LTTSVAALLAGVADGLLSGCQAHAETDFPRTGGLSYRASDCPSYYAGK
jgi:hypothetical protein